MAQSPSTYPPGRGKGKTAIAKIIHGPNGQRQSRAARAGLEFCPTRVRRYIRKIHPGRVRETAGVYLAAVLEYLTAEMLELSGYKARDEKKKRITERHIVLAVRKDEELSKLTKGVMIPGGVHHFIHEELLPGYKKQSAARRPRRRVMPPPSPGANTEKSSNSSSASETGSDTDTDDSASDSDSSSSSSSSNSASNNTIVAGIRRRSTEMGHQSRIGSKSPPRITNSTTTTTTNGGGGGGGETCGRGPGDDASDSNTITGDVVDS